MGTDRLGFSMDQSWKIAGPSRSKSTPANPVAFGRAPTDIARIELHELSLRDIDRPLLDHWLNLAQSASEPNIFNSPDFLKIALTHCDPKQLARVVTVWNGAFNNSPLIGLMPVLVNKPYGRFPVRFTQNWLHHNSFLGTPLVRSGFETQFWGKLLKYYDGLKQAGLFVHLEKMALDGPVFAALNDHCANVARRCDIVTSVNRAVLVTRQNGADYYAKTIRKKKRKELNRLRSRLSEIGVLTTVEGIGDHSLEQWIDEFLSLEMTGWKGANQSALANQNDTRMMFEQSVTVAYHSGQLHLIAMRLDDRAIAMLVSFISPPGGFSFKTAFDENFAHFSPGVLLQIDNFDVLSKNNIEWIDSCAAHDHPMINSLWTARRKIGRVSIALNGGLRPHLFNILRFVESAMARRRAAALETKATTA